VRKAVVKATRLEVDAEEARVRVSEYVFRVEGNERVQLDTGEQVLCANKKESPQLASLIEGLKAAGRNATDEQKKQIVAIVNRLPPPTWSTYNLTHDQANRVIPVLNGVDPKSAGAGAQLAKLASIAKEILKEHA
jgi:hypothetical protein